MVAERAAYFALVDQGVGHRAAARQVGINYRTCKRWRAAPKPAPIPASAEEVSGRFLSLGERIAIADLVRDPRVSMRSIARELGRSVSTVSRELARNQRLSVHTDRTRS